MTRAALVALAVLAAGCGKVNGSRSVPTIDTVTPDHGPAAGGATITITGTGLTDSSGTPIVVLGDREAAIVTSSDTELTFTLPAGTEQTTVDLTVSDDHGFTIAPGAFTYNPLPIVLAISPSGGRAAGGTTVTLTGRGFSEFEAGSVTVTIGGGIATDVQVMSDQMLTAVTSPTAVGTPAFTALDVRVDDANGSATLHRAFSTTKQGLMLMSRADQSLSFFDPTTKDSTKIGVLGTRLHSCALSPVDGTMFATGRDPSTGTHSLFTLDPLTGTATLIGPTLDATSGAEYGLSSLAFVGTTMFGFVDGPCCSTTVKRLVTVDPTTGKSTLVGANPVTGTRGITIGTRDTATVFYAETTAGTLDTLSTATSARVTGPTMSGGVGNKVHGLITQGDSLFVLEDGNPSTLYSVNPVSGALTVVSSVVAAGIAVCQTPPSF